MSGDILDAIDAVVTEHHADRGWLQHVRDALDGSDGPPGDAGASWVAPERREPRDAQAEHAWVRRVESWDLYERHVGAQARAQYQRWITGGHLPEDPVALPEPQSGDPTIRNGLDILTGARRALTRVRRDGGEVHAWLVDADTWDTLCVDAVADTVGLDDTAPERSPWWGLQNGPEESRLWGIRLVRAGRRLSLPPGTHWVRVMSGLAAAETDPRRGPIWHLGI